MIVKFRNTVIDNSIYIEFPIEENDFYDELHKIMSKDISKNIIEIEEITENTINISLYMEDIELKNDFLEELNGLAECLDSCDDTTKLAAVIEYISDNEGACTVSRVIEIADSLSDYYLYEGVCDMDALGKILEENNHYLSIPDYLECYFDYEGYAEWCDVSGDFTQYGFVEDLT